MESKEERLKKVKDAFAISVGSNEKPSEETIKLSKDYINGKISLEEMEKIIIERYKK